MPPAATSVAPYASSAAFALDTPKQGAKLEAQPLRHAPDEAKSLPARQALAALRRQGKLRNGAARDRRGPKPPDRLQVAEEGAHGPSDQVRCPRPVLAMRPCWHLRLQLAGGAQAKRAEGRADSRPDAAPRGRSPHRPGHCPGLGDPDHRNAPARLLHLVAARGGRAEASRKDERTASSHPKPATLAVGARVPEVICRLSEGAAAEGQDARSRATVRTERLDATRVGWRALRDSNPRPAA